MCRTPQRRGEIAHSSLLYPLIVLVQFQSKRTTKVVSQHTTLEKVGLRLRLLGRYDSYYRNPVGDRSILDGHRLFSLLCQPSSPPVSPSAWGFNHWLA